MAGILAAVMGLFGCSKNPKPEDVKSEQFTVGQVWRYDTRDMEPDSRVIIGKIERLKSLETVVHIKLINLRIKTPSAPDGYSKQMTHMPMKEAVLKASVTSLTNEKGDLTGFDEGYRTWLAAYRDGKAGWFTIPIKEIIEGMEQAMNK